MKVITSVEFEQGECLNRSMNALSRDKKEAMLEQNLRG